MRVYLPSTLPLLREWLAAGRAPGGPGYAVTPALREWYREASEEEIEYAATQAAGRGSLALLAAEPMAPRRRVVLAAEVADADVAVLGSPRAGVAVGVPVALSSWASALVDDEEADGVISVAASALSRAELGDEDAKFAVDEADAYELAWYAVQEIPSLFD
ncbi:MAG: hypothetical protein QOC82_410 [Frankiaceae bacterium]|nr:hypothetical protein [Frankiaceae bacterium]